MEANLARLGIPVSAYVDAEIVEVAAMLGANTVEVSETERGASGMPVGDPMDFLVR